MASAKAAQPQPLSGEVVDHRGRRGIGEHAAHLRVEGGLAAKLPALRRVQQFVVGNAAPQKEREARSQFRLRNFLRAARGGAGRIEFEAKQKIGSQEQTRKRGGDGGIEAVLAPRGFELRQKWLDVRRADFAAESAPRDGVENLRRAGGLLRRSRGPAYENPPPAGRFIDALRVVRPGDFHAVHRRRTGRPGKGRLADGHAPDFKGLHAAVVDTQLESGMNRGTTRVQRAAQRRATRAGDVRNRTFPFGEFVGKGGDHHVRAGLYVHPRLKEADSFAFRQIVPFEKGAQAVLAVKRKVVLHTNTAACSERHPRTEPGGLRIGSTETFRDGRRVAGACRVLADPARDFEILLQQERRHRKRVSDIVEPRRDPVGRQFVFHG